MNTCKERQIYGGEKAGMPDDAQSSRNQAGTDHHEFALALHVARGEGMRSHAPPLSGHADRTTLRENSWKGMERNGKERTGLILKGEGSGVMTRVVYESLKLTKRGRKCMFCFVEHRTVSSVCIGYNRLR